jgi:hypothetical protein
MGADIYLRSIWKPFLEKLELSPAPAPSAFESEADVEAFMSGRYDEMRASGGYFRNGYNAGDVMWAMGLSWQDTVKPMLDRGCHLPMPRARELIEMIEARPLTRDGVGAHVYEHMTAGVEPHPTTGPFVQMAHEAIAEAQGVKPREKLPPDFDRLFGFLNTRREELLTLLRKSIELDEPLYCDL